jgi:hypothetical protein
MGNVVNQTIDPATALRKRYEHIVLDNRLRLDERWAKPCRAFDLHITVEQTAVAAFEVVQRELLALEPSLLRIPARAMHINLAWLIPVSQKDDGIAKDIQWARHGRRWCTEIRTALAGLSPFELTYTSVLATDSAIIASAEPRDTVNKLRRELAKRLMLPGKINSGELVHTTLFRYSAPLTRPEELLSRLSETHLRIRSSVSELTVVREEIFPSLQTQVLERYRLTACHD